MFYDLQLAIVTSMENEVLLDLTLAKISLKVTVAPVRS